MLSQTIGHHKGRCDTLSGCNNGRKHNDIVIVAHFSSDEDVRDYSEACEEYRRYHERPRGYVDKRSMICRRDLRVTMGGRHIGMTVRFDREEGRRTQNLCFAAIHLQQLT